MGEKPIDLRIPVLLSRLWLPFEYDGHLYPALQALSKPLYFQRDKFNMIS